MYKGENTLESRADWIDVLKDIFNKPTLFAFCSNRIFESRGVDVE